LEPAEVLRLIKTRRSVRRYSGQPLSEQELEMVLEAGRWAPSGQNNQPWRFAVVAEPAVKDQIAPLTRYGKIIQGAAALICCFAHLPSMYHEVKDHQSIGACLQNMLLMAHGAGLGAVWLGEILKSAAQVRQVLGLGEELELMAVLALGRPGPGNPQSSRKPLAELVLGRYDP
jgi:nitroreductase